MFDGNKEDFWCFYKGVTNWVLQVRIRGLVKGTTKDVLENLLNNVGRRELNF